MRYKRACAAPATGRTPPLPNGERVQSKTRSTEQAFDRRDSAAQPPRMLPGMPPAMRSGIDSTWLGSSFDLAQGLDVKVMESKLSPEMLDELFRS
jgi:hypothetical protein